MRTAEHEVTRNEIINIFLKDAELQGFLTIPKNATGIVVFAHGSGSSRLSPRNQFVADYLNREKIGTLLFDLLTLEEEEQDITISAYRFNIPFLAERLVEVVDWLTDQLKGSKHDLPIGVFGASTGAAAAIVAGTRRPEMIKAIVSRGGRPDLATLMLTRIKVPTLLIVGGSDTDVLRLNREAYQYIHADKEIHIVKGASVDSRF